MRYSQAYDGDWMQPRMRGFYLRCCGCALVHRLEFRIVGRKVQFRAWRMRSRKPKA